MCVSDGSWLSMRKLHTCATAQALQATVGAIRNARAEYNVELGRRIAARVTVASGDLRAALDAELDVLCSLAKLDRSQACLRPRTFPPGPHFQIQIISCPHVFTVFNFVLYDTGSLSRILPACPSCLWQDKRVVVNPISKQSCALPHHMR